MHCGRYREIPFACSQERVVHSNDVHRIASRLYLVLGENIGVITAITVNELHPR